MAAMNVPQVVDLRIDAGWIIPVEPAGALTGHALIVHAGKIVALLPAEAADDAFAPRAETRTRRHAWRHLSPKRMDCSAMAVRNRARSG